MGKTELINTLLYNVALEHSAIVQYLYHIFLIKDAEITSEVEEIARQEMRHLKWFAQKVVQLGGQVALNRIEEAIQIGGPSWEDMLSKDVNAEQMAIEIYSRQLEMVKDESVKKLLERVINDERHHKLEFSQLVEKAKQAVTVESHQNSTADPQVTQVLNKFLRDEYQVIIKYLYQFFHSKNCDYKDVMLDLATESMVHMGKIGEKIGELNGVPDINADLSPKPISDFEKEVKESIIYEQRSGNEYKESISRIENPEIKELFEFIDRQEDYHKQKLMEFFSLMKRFTVGDLRQK